MASQTPGALRAEGLGTSMVHQMAAGAAPLSHPRFDAPLQRSIQHLPCAPMGTNDLPLPHANGYSEGNQQNESQYRYSLAASMGPSTLPPFPSSQKAADPLYDLQYAGEHPSAHQLRQSYPTGPGSPQTDVPRHRSGSSGSNVESGNARWPAMYAMYPDDHRQASQARSQEQQPHYAPLDSDVRTNPFHVAATM